MRGSLQADHDPPGPADHDRLGRYAGAVISCGDPRMRGSLQADHDPPGPADHDRLGRYAGTALRAEAGSAPFHPPTHLDAVPPIRLRNSTNGRPQDQAKFQHSVRLHRKELMLALLDS